jgi:hypothetical protein
MSSTNGRMSRATNIATTQDINNQRGSMSADTLNEWANRIYVIAGFLAVILTAITVAASFVIWRTSSDIAGRKERELALYQAGARTEIERAKSAAAEARTRGQEANAEAAKANERAAQLEKDAAASRLEAERIKQQVSWRSLSAPQAQRLLKALAERPGAVNLRYTDGDPETLGLTAEIANILERAHWQVAAGSTKFANALAFEIHIPNQPSDNLKALQKAFHEAGIPFDPSPLPPVGAEFNVSTINGAPTLFIGSKRPPKF